MKNSIPFMNTIVLADDDPDQGLLFSRILKQVDPSKTLTIVKDGTELMDLLTRQVPDLLFLDMNMPCKNGYECLKDIRSKPTLKDLTIVVYSSSSYMSDIARSYLLRADLYMVKPFNAGHLRNALESILTMAWLKDFTNQKYYFINNRFVPYTT